MSSVGHAYPHVGNTANNKQKCSQVMGIIPRSCYGGVGEVLAIGGPMMQTIAFPLKKWAIDIIGPVQPSTWKGHCYNVTTIDVAI